MNDHWKNIDSTQMLQVPKKFELPEEMTLTEKFKTIGNGVPYVLSSGIANTINCFFDKIKKFGETEK